MFVALAHGEEVSVRELQSGDWERLQFGAFLGKREGIPS